MNDQEWILYCFPMLLIFSLLSLAYIAPNYLQGCTVLESILSTEGSISGRHVRVRACVLVSSSASCARPPNALRVDGKFCHACRWNRSNIVCSTPSILSFYPILP
jgi:hypothetical protein